MRSNCAGNVIVVQNHLPSREPWSQQLGDYRTTLWKGVQTSCLCQMVHGTAENLDWGCTPPVQVSIRSIELLNSPYLCDIHCGVSIEYKMA